MILYIIRHGQPNYEKDCLTDLGWQQAEAVGRRMAKSGINKIFASPMGRAQETATPASRLLGLTINTENWTHEIGDERLTPFPDGKMKSVSLIQNTYFRENGNLDIGYNDACTCPGFRESGMRSKLAFLEENGNDFLERLGYKYENGVYRIITPNEDKVALFCHAAFSRAWLSILLHVPVHMMWSSFDYDMTGVTVVEFKNNENGVTAPQCLRFSDTSHLYAENVPGWK